MHKKYVILTSACENKSILLYTKTIDNEFIAYIGKYILKSDYQYHIVGTSMNNCKDFSTFEEAKEFLVSKLERMSYTILPENLQILL